MAGASRRSAPNSGHFFFFFGSVPGWFKPVHLHYTNMALVVLVGKPIGTRERSNIDFDRKE